MSAQSSLQRSNSWYFPANMVAFHLWMRHGSWARPLSFKLNAGTFSFLASLRQVCIREQWCDKQYWMMLTGFIERARCTLHIWDIMRALEGAVYLHPSCSMRHDYWRKLVEWSSSLPSSDWFVKCQCYHLGLFAEYATQCMPAGQVTQRPTGFMLAWDSRRCPWEGRVRGGKTVWMVSRHSVVVTTSLEPAFHEGYPYNDKLSYTQLGPNCWASVHSASEEHQMSALAIIVTPQSLCDESIKAFLHTCKQPHKLNIISLGSVSDAYRVSLTVEHRDQSSLV